MTTDSGFCLTNPGGARSLPVASLVYAIPLGMEDSDPYPIKATYNGTSVNAAAVGTATLTVTE